MTASFAYSAIAAGLFIIIFIPMTCIISCRRYSLFLIALGVLIDITMASLGSYVSSNALKNVEDSQIFSSIVFFFYQFYGFLMLLVYVIIRIIISRIEAVRDLWSEGSKLTRTCYVTQLLFPGATGFLLLIHLVVWLACLIKIVFPYLWTIIIWPIQYFIDNPDVT
jgi:hypothetical protein